MKIPNEVKISGGWFIILVCFVAVMAAGVNGIFNNVTASGFINSTSGYKVNSAAGSSGEALCSDGTYFDTPCSTAGTGITALTGPVTASGSGSVASAITATGVTAGSYVSPNITVNAAGQITAAANPSHTILNCRSVSCAGGSTYTDSTTYTNSSGHLLTEYVAIQGTDSSGGCTGPSGLLTGFVNGVAILFTEINNDCNTANISGFTLLVPPGATFSVTVTEVGSGTTYVLYSWYEMAL
jgi:hypothetical protein